MSAERRLSLHTQFELPENVQGSVLEFLHQETTIRLRATRDSVLEPEDSYQLVIETQVLEPLAQYSGKATLTFLPISGVWKLSITPIEYSGSILLTGGTVRPAILTTPDPY